VSARLEDGVLHINVAKEAEPEDLNKKRSILIE
jgi:HSP20 family molecular chaperone IbpA